MQYTGFVNADDNSVIDTEPTLSSTATAISDVGNYDIVLANGTDNNYSFLLINGTLSVTKKNISITADDITKSIGDTDPTLTYQITNGNLVNGDTFSGNLTRIAGESIGTYAIQIGSLTSGRNYLESFTEGIFTISSTASTKEDFVDNNLKIYPNPVNDILNIKISNSIKIEEVNIYNILGKIVLKTINQHKINVSKLNKGVFLIKIKTNKGVLIKKLIKE